jgi:hypothetical protein
MCMPTINQWSTRRTFWVSTQRVRLRHLGDVTVVLSTCRRNDGPKHTKILVTNLPEMVTARQMVSIDLRRWWVALLMKPLKGVVGLGPHQVTTQVEQGERSVAVAIMAYLLLLKLQAKHIPADRPWSAWRLQRAFATAVIEAQCERSAHQLARKWLQIGKAA